jgi:hypothetical protein
VCGECVCGFETAREYRFFLEQAISRGERLGLFLWRVLGGDRRFKLTDQLQAGEGIWGVYVGGFVFLLIAPSLLSVNRRRKVCCYIFGSVEKQGNREISKEVSCC